jgi:hypothetical protein
MAIRAILRLLAGPLKWESTPHLQENSLRLDGWPTLEVDSELGDKWDVQVIFGVRSSLPDLKPTKTVVTLILAATAAARETPDRARGATAAQLSVKARMRVRIPPGPFSVLWRRPIPGRECRDISPSNLTLFPPPPILKLTESCTTFLMTPDIRGHFRYHQAGSPPLKLILVSTIPTEGASSFAVFEGWAAPMPGPTITRSSLPISSLPPSPPFADSRPQCLKQRLKVRRRLAVKGDTISRARMNELKVRCVEGDASNSLLQRF